MDITDIRRKNLNAIMDILRFNDGLTKKDIAQMTNLSFSTVSNMCNELKEQQILSEEKIGSNIVGRIPSTIRFLYKNFCGICINLQMKNELEFAILNFRNEVLFKHRYDISSLKTPQEIISFAHQVFLQLKGFPWTQGIAFVGVAIAVSACYDRRNHLVVNSAVPVLENAPLKEMAESTFGMAAYIENEANACAISMLHCQKRYTDIVYIHLSQGVGLGVICDRLLLRGKHGYAAEISHIPLGNPTQRDPGCKAMGCSESDLSLSAMVRDFPSELADDDIHQKWRQALRDIQADSSAYAVYLGEKGARLGALCGILSSIFDPEVLYIGGTVASLGPYLRESVEPILEKRAKLYHGCDLQLMWDEASDITLLNGLNQIIYEEWQPFE